MEVLIVDVSLNQEVRVEVTKYYENGKVIASIDGKAVPTGRYRELYYSTDGNSAMTVLTNRAVLARQPSIMVIGIPPIEVTTRWMMNGFFDYPPAVVGQGN